MIISIPVLCNAPTLSAATYVKLPTGPKRLKVYPMVWVEDIIGNPGNDDVVATAVVQAGKSQSLGQESKSGKDQIFWEDRIIFIDFTRRSVLMEHFPEMKEGRFGTGTEIELEDAVDRLRVWFLVSSSLMTVADYVRESRTPPQPSSNLLIDAQMPSATQDITLALITASPDNFLNVFGISVEDFRKVVSSLLRINKKNITFSDEVASVIAYHGRFIVPISTPIEPEEPVDDEVQQFDSVVLSDAGDGTYTLTVAYGA